MDFSTAEIVSSSDDPGTAEVITGATVDLCKCKSFEKKFNTLKKNLTLALTISKYTPYPHFSDKINSDNFAKSEKFSKTRLFVGLLPTKILLGIFQGHFRINMSFCKQNSYG